MRNAGIGWHITEICRLLRLQTPYNPVDRTRNPSRVMRWQNCTGSLCPDIDKQVTQQKPDAKCGERAEETCCHGNPRGQVVNPVGAKNKAIKDSE